MPPYLRSAVIGLTGLLVTTPLFSSEQTATLNDQTYISHGLVGVGRIPSTTRDKFGETFGSFSGFTFDRKTWLRNPDGSYSGLLYTQPDRGFGLASGATTNYSSRFNKVLINFLPSPVGSTSQNQVLFALADTIKYQESNGALLTSYDPTPIGAGSRPGFPPLPQAFNGRLSFDGEGIVLNPDGSLWVSDEYGPYLYKFSATGTLLAALRPPEAFIARRNGLPSFASDNPPTGQPAPSPSNPTAGRQNNQGLESISASPDGSTLFTILQSATRQDGGNGGSSLRQFSRLLAYDLTTPSPTLKGEYVVILPTYLDKGVTKVGAVCEIVAVNNTQILMLTRDSNGHGTPVATSLFRRVMVYDISAATNIVGSVYDDPATPIAPGSVLAAGIVAATSTEVLNINDSLELAKFGLTNGPTDSANNLSDKWEAMALVPTLDPAAPNDWFLFIGNDNDFTTSDGFQDSSAYNAGLETDTMVLVYKLTIPSRLTYVSTLARVGNGNGSGNQALTGTFVVNGARPKTMLIRGVGPSLSNIGLSGIADPMMTVFKSATVPVAANDDWGVDPIKKAEIVAAATAAASFPLIDGSKDAALLLKLDPGTYTIELKSANGPGSVLLELIEIPN